jgi:hypothetical protein
MLNLKEEDFNKWIKMTDLLILFNERGKKFNGRPFVYMDIYQYINRTKLFYSDINRLPPEYGDYLLDTKKENGKLVIMILTKKHSENNPPIIKKLLDEYKEILTE